MIKISICDDNKNFHEYIINLTAEYQASLVKPMEISIKTFESGDELLAALEDGASFDILFLDVLMPFINGIEVAKEIRIFDKNTKIIFFTSSMDFAIDSYDVNAFHYLMKNCSKEKFFSVLGAAITEINDAPDNFITIKTKDGFVKVLFNSIECIETRGKKTKFYLSTNETYETYSTLSELESIFLMQNQFIKPYRSYIVNMDHVIKLAENELKTLNGHSIPISKASYSDVKKSYINYSFTKGGKSF